MTGPSRVRLSRGQNFQGVLPRQAGPVNIAVEQRADALQAGNPRSIPGGATLFPYLAVDGGNATVVATSITDRAISYAVAVTISC